MDSSHGEILDTITTTKYNLIVKNEDRCYRIPDAFVTEQSLGVDFTTVADDSFNAIGAESAGEYRSKTAEGSKSEFSAEVSGYGAAIGASYSRSRETETVRACGHTIPPFYLPLLVL